MKTKIISFIVTLAMLVLLTLNVSAEFATPVPPIGILTPEDIAEFLAGYERADIVVNGEVIESPKAYMTADGILMLPVRAISEILGKQGFATVPVEWFADTRTVQVGRFLSFTLDHDAYSFARMAPVSLGAAPVLKGSSTYVPVNLFAMLTGTDNIVWYLQDNQLIIDIEIPAE